MIYQSDPSRNSEDPQEYKLISLDRQTSSTLVLARLTHLCKARIGQSRAIVPCPRFTDDVKIQYLHLRYSPEPLVLLWKVDSSLWYIFSRSGKEADIQGHGWSYVSSLRLILRYVGIFRLLCTLGYELDIF